MPTTVNQVVPVHAKTQIHPRSRGERGTGSTITIDLTEHPELLAKIREAAKEDDREPSKWLRRRIVMLGGVLFGELLQAQHYHPIPGDGERES